MPLRSERCFSTTAPASAAHSNTCTASDIAPSRSSARPGRRRPTARRTCSCCAEADRLELEVRVVTTDYELQHATDLARALLEDARHATAVFCFSDSIAYGVYAAARELAITIPEDLSVIGYDDHPISALLSPPLTSFSWGSKRLVGIAVGLLLSAIDGTPRARRRVIIKPELRDRGSTSRRDSPRKRQRRVSP